MLLKKPLNTQEGIIVVSILKVMSPCSPYSSQAELGLGTLVLQNLFEEKVYIGT